MRGAEEEPSRSIREGFPVEVAYRLRLEGGAGSGWVKVKAGGLERALCLKGRDWSRGRPPREERRSRGE